MGFFIMDFWFLLLLLNVCGTTQGFNRWGSSRSSCLSLKAKGESQRTTGQQDVSGRRKGTTKRDYMLEQVLESVDFTRSKAPPQIPLLQDPLLPMVEMVALAADKRKASSISAFRVSHMTEVTTFMLVIEGNSRPQNQAIALAVEEDIMVNFTTQPHKEGDAASGWILLDYGSLIVHIMTPQMRNFYKLEKRWKDAEIYDLQNVLPKPRQGGVGKEVSGDEPAVKGDVDQEDPFWG